MIKVRKKFCKIDTDSAQDLAIYEDILNDPQCHITDRVLEKEKEQEYNDRGNLIRQRERMYYLLHWETKVL